MPSKEYTTDEFTKLLAQYEDLRSDRLDFETEWRKISDYLLPGRGIFQLTSTPRKRSLTSPFVVNPAGADALQVLTSGIQGALTSPSRPWFTLSWANSRLNDVPFLRDWIQDANKQMHAQLHMSNFYSSVHSFYTEYAGFGTGAMYVGEDTGGLSPAFRFEILTVGEYAFSVNAQGLPDTFFRTIFMTPRQMVERFGDAVSNGVRDAVKDNRLDKNRPYVPVLEAIQPEAYNENMSYTQKYCEMGAYGGQPQQTFEVQRKPLEVSGFYEFPYMVAVWDVIGSDIYGLGPGSRAIPDIQRLQEMEKAFLRAAHRDVDPPIWAPSRMRGKLNTLPGGRNYGSNPEERIQEIFAGKFDYNGVGGAIERVEQRIKTNFFNDIFLSANRDPNATPYKATEAAIRDREKTLRLGPVIERLQYTFLTPVIERCFNIMLRKGLFRAMPPEMAAMVGDYAIKLISPLALAQKGIAIRGIQDFLGFVGQAANIRPEALDKVDLDRAIDEYADISGAPQVLLNSPEQVKTIRDNRAEAQQAQQKQQRQVAAANIQADLQLKQSEVAKNRSIAAENTAKSRAEMAEVMGTI
jgi:hypothetical protein